MKEKWQQLSQKEQRTIKIGGVVLALLIFLRFIWWPLYSNIESTHQEIQQQAELIEWMQPRVHRIINARESGQQAVGKKTITMLENSLTTLKPYVQAFGVNASQQVNIEFKAVPMPMWVRWLEAQSNRGWQVEQVHITPATESGTVDVNLTLS